MHRFLLRLSLVSSLTIISSCTVQISQVQFPKVPPHTHPSGELETEPLSKLDDEVNDTDVTLGIDGSEGEVLCAQFEFPEIEDIPELPYVPPEKRADDDYVSNLLVEHVNRLTEFIDDAEKKINASYQKYLETCR